MVGAKTQQVNWYDYKITATIAGMMSREENLDYGNDQIYSDGRPDATGMVQFKLTCLLPYRLASFDRAGSGAIERRYCKRTSVPCE